MKKLIEIPGDGNCLFNSILLGYIDANNGQYPVVNGTEIRTQEELRQAVQNYYQNILNGYNNELRQELIQTVRNELIDAILQENFQGFSSNPGLLGRLQHIRDIINDKADEGIRAVMFLEQINEDLILAYVHSLDTIWGGEIEINTLRRIFYPNIRISGHGNMLDNEIELMYVGGNHYHVYVNHSDNAEVSQFIEQIGGNQSNIKKLSFKNKQKSKIESLDDRQFHLLLQIIFNKREAEHSDINKSIKSEEIDYAIGVLNELRLLEASVKKHSQIPCFVLNCPMYVPDDCSDDGYESDYSAIDLPENFDPSRKDKYFIAEQTLDSVEIVEGNYNYDRESRCISPLINKLRTQGFEEHDFQYQSSIGIVIGLNRPKSLSGKKNSYLDKELSSFQNTDREKVFGFRWQYKWMETYKTKKGAEGKKPVDYSKVLQFYKQLKKYDHEAANDFRKKNEALGEVPYSLIRETIKNHKYTKEIVKFFQKQGHYVMYLSIIDSDTMNFNGVYSAYMRIANQYQQPTIMSTGYIFSDNPDQHSEMQGIIPILSFGSQVDRFVRIITAREFPLGVYYPEPNFCIFIPVGAETIIESFLDKDKKKEAIALIRQVQSRAGFSAVFIDDNPIVTRIPDRAYYNRQKGEQFEFSDMFLQGIYSRGTQEDFENLASIAQSHFGGNNWALSFIGVDRPSEAGKANARKSGLERLLNIYRGYQFQDRIDKIDNSELRIQLKKFGFPDEKICKIEHFIQVAKNFADFRSQLKESDLTDEQINQMVNLIEKSTNVVCLRLQLKESGLSGEQISRIESIMEITTNAAYVFVTAPNIDVYEFIEFLHILFDFSYETRIPKNEIRSFYIRYKELFDMDLLSNDNVVRIARYCGISILEDGNIDQEILEEMEPHLDYIDRNIDSEDSSLAGDLVEDLIDDEARNMEGVCENYHQLTEEDLFWSDDTRIENAKHMVAYDQCPREYFRKGFFGSDSDRDSYDSDDVRYYAAANSQNSDDESYEEDDESEESQSDYYGDEDADQSGGENDYISFCLTGIVYDNPELIHSLFQREAFGYHFSSLARNKTESPIISNYNFSISFNSNVTSVAPYSDGTKQEQSNISSKIASCSVTSYLNIVMNSQKLDYLDPLSDQYKSLVQEWHHIESLNTITAEGYLSSYNDLFTSIIGGMLLYIYHSHIYE